MNRFRRFLAFFRIPRLIRRPAVILLAVLLPVLIGMGVVLGAVVSNLLQREAESKLETLNRNVADFTSSWLSLNARALQQLVQQEEIWQMDAAAQKPVLQKMAALYPYMYLVSTTDLKGMNVARNDAVENKDYSSRQWFSAASAGLSVSYQTLIGATTGQPAVVVSVPIKNNEDEIVGVGMFASDLDVLSVQVHANPLGNTGATYIIDESDQIVAHPDPEMIKELRSAADNPAVIKLRQGYVNVIHFTDENGARWLASVTLLDNGWGVISQQQEAEIFAPIYRAQRVNDILVIGSLLIILITLTYVARGLVLPITNLTEAAVAISSGDFNRRVRVQSKDELGMLAQTFNGMTEQLQAIQAGLEQQVAKRTAELEARTAQLEVSSAQLSASASDLDERSTYLQTVADVSSIVATILDPDQLMQQVVELVRQRFNLYYVGLFQVDDSRERAWLRAGTGQAGKAMLERKHAIQIGTGMVGWCIEHAEPRIALQAAEDEVRLAAPDLPETRSEAALPLRSRDVVIGALSIQSAVPNDFNEENIVVFQLLADQVAVALDNAHLYRQSQDALRSLQESYGQQSVEGWGRLLKTRSDLAYLSDSRGLVKANSVWYPEMEAALQQGDLVVAQNATDDDLPLAIPIKVRGQIVGVLDARKDAGGGNWRSEDVALVRTVVEQLGVALESAQLYQETQNRAERERLVAEITGKLRASNDPKEILQTAASELRRVLRVKDARVMLRNVAQQGEGGDSEIDIPETQPLQPNGQE